jgi:hypothetical protein
MLRRRRWTRILRRRVLCYVLSWLPFLWSYGVLRYSISLRVIIVFRDITYAIIYFIRDIWFPKNPFGRMCGTIYPGSCIRWVLGFGIKTGYDRFPLLVMALGWARLVHMIWVLFHPLFPGVEGHILGQGVPVRDGEQCFWRRGVFSWWAYKKGRDLESFLEEHHNELVIDLQDVISLVAETLDELPEGLFLLLDDTG